MIHRLAILGGILVLGATACGGTDTAETTAAPTIAPPATETTAAPTTAPTAVPSSTSPTVTGAAPATSIALAMADSALGEILVDADGNTLYLFTPDDSGPSVCNGDCAAAWPPVIGEATAGPGIDSTLLGTAARDDGATQATYNSWPLYYFAGDAAPGDTNGQGLNEVWYVISATGEAIR